MPNAQEPERPAAPPPSYEGWKWVFDGTKSKEAPPPANSIHESAAGTFDAFKTYHYLPEPHPYTFESSIPPTGPPTDSTFSYHPHGSKAEDGSPAAAAASPISESEWAQYWLKEQEKKGAGKDELAPVVVVVDEDKKKNKKEEKRKG